ncbi:MAG: DUF6326 family protein [Pseudomonadota bacterium]
MNNKPVDQNLLDDIKVHVRIKISALWTTLVACYIYADYFELYVPGKLTDMLAQNIGPLGAVTQAKLIGTSILLAIPILMVFLSLVLPSKISRWANIVFGVVYALVAIATICSPGAWIFYRFFCAVEIVLTLIIIWYAWHWPKKQIHQPNEC